MKILTLYVLRHFAAVFAVALFGFGGVYVVVDFFEKLDDILEKKAAALDAVLYFAYKVPAILVQGIPVAVLLATLIGLGLLQRNREIIALRAAGLRAWVYAGPMVMSSLALAFVTFTAGETLGRSFTRKAAELWQQKVEKKDVQLDFLQENVWYRGQGFFLQARTYDASSKIFHGVSVFYLDEHFHLRMRLDAQRLVWAESGWRAEKGTVLAYEDGLARHRPFQHMDVPLTVHPQDLAVAAALPEDLRWDQLYGYIKRLIAEGYDAVPYRVELHLRVATAFAALILGLIGVSLGLHLGHRTGIALGIAVGLGLTFAYLVLLQVGASFARSQMLPPALGVWMPNGLFAAVGAALWVRAPQ
ncbi:LPS export ABC transporter permease LptG [Desulfosoma sp.]|uniref:LPS export ABC transporter permease LptG n=1 Tax=Desulfosoma sp. TaxID=2603217 RepID=UPI004049E746